MTVSIIAIVMAQTKCKNLLLYFFERQLMIHVIHLVHSINLKICIEGVETKEELEQLRAMNPDYIQGYFFSRPIPRDEFIKKYLE